MTYLMEYSSPEVAREAILELLPVVNPNRPEDTDDIPFEYLSIIYKQDLESLMDIPQIYQDTYRLLTCNLVEEIRRGVPSHSIAEYEQMLNEPAEYPHHALLDSLAEPIANLARMNKSFYPDGHYLPIERKRLDATYSKKAEYYRHLTHTLKNNEGFIRRLPFDTDGSIVPVSIFVSSASRFLDNVRSPFSERFSFICKRAISRASNSDGDPYLLCIQANRLWMSLAEGAQNLESLARV
jgi:hypothetical protein